MVRIDLGHYTDWNLPGNLIPEEFVVLFEKIVCFGTFGLQTDFVAVENFHK